jgi:methionyl-tRNA formyltransferase
MGTPEFGVPSLELMSESGYKPVLCISQPDRPKGRKKIMQPTPIKIKAEELGIKVAQPEDVNDSIFLEELEKLNPDIIVTVAYGGYLKKKIRKIPKFGCINLHPSLLPLYRGSAPINYALFNNDTKTGITIFKIIAKMDAGPIILQSETEILPEDNFTSLSKKLSIQGAKDIIKVLQLSELGKLQYLKQDNDFATFSNKIFKKDMLIDWNKPASDIRNLIRGLAEYPAATATFRGKRIKIIEVELKEKISNLPSGTILEVKKNIGILVSGNKKDILIKKVQPAGKKIMSAHAFNLGARINIGETFENGF